MNFDNNVPIYIQLVEELKISIISGTIGPNEKLLSVVNELAVHINQDEFDEIQDIYEQTKNVLKNRNNVFIIYSTTTQELHYVDIRPKKFGLFLYSLSISLSFFNWSRISAARSKSRILAALCMSFSSFVIRFGKAFLSIPRSTISSATISSRLR